MRSLGLLMLLMLPVSDVAAGDDGGWSEKAAALAAAEKWPEAVAAYASWTKAEPENGQAWLGLGQAHFEMKAYDKAIEAYGKALAHGASQGAYRTARAYAAKGDSKQALAWLERVADAGAKIYSSVMAADEFAPMHENAAFKAVTKRLMPCGAEPFRQFDFWLGAWDVKDLSNPTSAGGAVNHITLGHDDCAVLESYTNGAYTGSSVNFYNSATKQWHQTWIDNQGYALDLNGGLVNGSMVLSSDPSVKPINRITWTPKDDGNVRQLWEVSGDGGKTWAVEFDGLYAKREPK